MGTDRGEAAGGLGGARPPQSARRGPGYRPGPLGAGFSRLSAGPVPSPAAPGAAAPAGGGGIPPSLADLGRPLRLEPGRIVFSKGESAQRCFFVLSGEAVVSSPGREGSEVEVARIRAGEWFAEAILFASPSYPAGARAGEAGASLLSFGRDDLLARIASSADAAAYFISLLARKCLALNRRLDELTVMPVRQRLARYLVSLCDAGACGLRPPCELRLPAKKREIAAELGMVPETFSRTAKALEADGLVRLSSRSVLVLDCARLRAEAEG